MSSERRRILVVANETVGGYALIDAVRQRADQDSIVVRVICPQNQPKKGLVLYEDSVSEAAQNRLETTLAELQRAGVQASGEVTDPDPYVAIEDELAATPADEIIISTHPETRSGWLRRDLIERVREDFELPVQHVVVDLDADRDEALRTLVVANQTMGGAPLLEALRAKAADRRHSFIVLCPQSDDGGDESAKRLEHTLKQLRDEGFEAIGQVGHPDPFTAIQHAIDSYAVDEIVISTFPETRSGWLRTDLVQRVRGSTDKPVEHVVSEQEPA
jgi:hypothetical protein